MKIRYLIRFLHNINTFFWICIDYLVFDWQRQRHRQNFEICVKPWLVGSSAKINPTLIGEENETLFIRV